ncbi:ubiquitin-like domain containing protein [Encephalitozoon cuniculi EcunIII-L]|nr:ubiquitin-like domain containing protein [Encephalitozoon cuniculi EcunIII-L]UYI26217.1 hypothetical protein J0A71_01g00320 [Encephalitozoon cuniculi]
MIVRAINYESLHIDDQFGSIEELKTKISQKYGIPINSQHIIFNSKFYVLGIFDSPLTVSSDTYTNPLGCFGCPDSLFNDLAGNGMTTDEIREYAFPHKDDPAKEEDPDLSSVIDTRAIAKRITENRYEDAYKIPNDLSEKEKTIIMESPGEYIDLVLKQIKEILRSNTKY